MPTERRQQLDELKFVWDPFESVWERGFGYLKRYKDREGHCRVPDSHKEEDFRLGGWVSTQRQNQATIASERRRRLDNLGFVWDAQVSALAWEQGLSYLKIYRRREGHCRVPHKHKEEDFRLGGWVNNQRSRRETMPIERRQRLDELGFIWDILTDQWEEGLSYLKRYRDREGHCSVKQRHIENGFRLGQWVTVQRQNRDAMSADHRHRLDAIKFVWEPHNGAWDEGFAALIRFAAREGHCRVPTDYVEGTYKLGGWVGNQRSIRETMPTERKQRLDEIGFVWRAKK